MASSPSHPAEDTVTSRLKELAKDIFSLMNTAPLEQKRRLLRLLEELKGGDRRKYPKKRGSVRVTYATQNLLGRDRIRDIGVGGLCLDATSPLPVGQQVTLIFSPPFVKREMNIAGVVARAPRHRVANQGLAGGDRISMTLRCPLSDICD